MELDAIRNLTDGELSTQVQQAGEQLFRIRFQKSMGNLEGLKALKSHKRMIAQTKTIQRERELAAIVQAAPIAKVLSPDSGQRAAKKKKAKA